MARKIIITDANKGGGDPYVRAVFWLTAPAFRTIPRPNLTSAVSDATALELTALQSGSVVEVLRESGQFPSGTSLANIQAGLVTAYNAEQTALNQTAPPILIIGKTWDGTTWT